ncbi:sulfate ABC transporter substrate-binding protein [Castellaniella sp.]|uniref:sulfate ABC transporter substrate-binding protein n=1 Tax=Castellaniella sp. TaxID=1955812 RepID=UPI002AFDFC61|nr:sulfate ABC transporter substrate-binding protein [Castellaniella sp.]
MRFRLLPWLTTAVLALGTAQASNISLLNASYDPTRELYQAYNTAFSRYWLNKTGDHVLVRQSHGGSGKQARSVLDGLPADIVTLALAPDIDILAARGLVRADWQQQYPQHSVPYYSTIVFLVRKGNPKNIRDWPDLLHPGVQVITPNPKTSGGARWNYLAAWGAALLGSAGDEKQARDYIRQLYRHVPMLDTGARAATTSFAERGIGDVLITWENEAFLAIRELGADRLEMVIPPISIRAEPPVALVEQTVARRNTRAVAQAYLEYLYSPEAQEIVAQHYYRPTLASAAQRHAAQFAPLSLFTIRDLGPDWASLQAQHFSDGGIFDQIYQPESH